VVRALENVGKRIVRQERSRFSQMNGDPWHQAHTRWNLDPAQTSKALQGAWDIVPAMLDGHGCCGVTTKQVTDMLDGYVRGLVSYHQEHRLFKLRLLFESTLGLSVSEPEPYLQ
jgi:hypothetical protein